MKLNGFTSSTIKPLSAVSTGAVNPLGSDSRSRAMQKVSPGSDGEDMIGSFSDALKKAVNDLSALERNSSDKTNDLVTGKLENVHDLMIAMEKSKIGLSMAIEVRNKVIESYKEVMRMQI